MTWLDRLWIVMDGNRVTPVEQMLSDVPAEQSQRQRESLLVWLQSLETLARGLGYPAPTPSASTISPSPEATVHLPGTQNSPLSAWSTQWAQITHAANNNLPPESLFDPAQPGADGMSPWGALKTRAEQAHAPQAVVTHLAERAAAPGPVPRHSVDERFRQWWQARLQQPWSSFGPNPPEAHGTTPAGTPAPGAAPAGAPHAHHAHADPETPAHAPGAAPAGAPAPGAAPGAPAVPANANQAPAIVPPPDSGGGWGKWLLGALAAGVVLLKGDKKGRKAKILQPRPMSAAAMRRARIHRVDLSSHRSANARRTRG
jgi:hypothetical protein